MKLLGSTRRISQRSRRGNEGLSERRRGKQRVFLGEHHHTVDDKGRVVLPAKFRASLAQGCVVAKGQDRCLVVYPVDVFSGEADQVSSLPRSGRRNRDYSRALFAAADQQEPDKQGRITLSSGLRSYAGIDRDVSVNGMYDRVEIWDRKGWEELRPQIDQYYSEIEEALTE